MRRKRNGYIPLYDGDKNCFVFGDVDISSGEEFIWLQLRWRDTNGLATAEQKEIEWNRLVQCMIVNRMYEWKEEYIHEYFDKHAKMYLPNKYYNKLLRGINV